LKDIARISDRLMDMVMSRKGVQLFLMCDETIWDLFRRLPEGKKKHFAPGSLDEYYKFLSHLDIGIAPLEDTPFNRSRSDVKFLEYAAHGVVPVVQTTGPYLGSVKSGETGLFFRSTDELIATLDYLVSDSQARSAISTGAYEYVVRERNQQERGSDRVQFYLELLSKRKNKQSIESCSALDMFSSMCNCQGAKRNGRHLYLSATRYELLLQAGVVESPSNPGKSWGLFAEAMEMEPSLYMPYLFGASVSDDPAKTLRKATELNPDSIVSRLHLGHAYYSKNMIEKAVESFEAAASIFPEYEQPYIECAKVLNETGLKQEGVELLRRAISLIPQVIRGSN
jgi:tetratricopeptide (TPR) repeat protein